MALRLDHHDAVRADPMVLHLEQPLLEGVGQGRRADAEAQVDGVRDLVDVLAARSLRADGVDLDLALAQRDCGCLRFHRSPPAARAVGFSATRLLYCLTDRVPARGQTWLASSMAGSEPFPARGECGPSETIDEPGSESCHNGTGGPGQPDRKEEAMIMSPGMSKAAFWVLSVSLLLIPVHAYGQGE